MPKIKHPSVPSLHVEPDANYISDTHEVVDKKRKKFKGEEQPQQEQHSFEPASGKAPKKIVTILKGEEQNRPQQHDFQALRVASAPETTLQASAQADKQEIAAKKKKKEKRSHRDAETSALAPIDDNIGRHREASSAGIVTQFQIY